MKYKQAINRLKTELEMDRKEVHYCEVMINKLNENILMLLNSIVAKKETIRTLNRDKLNHVAWQSLDVGHKHTDTKKKLITYVNEWCK